MSQQACAAAACSYRRRAVSLHMPSRPPPPPPPTHVTAAEITELRHAPDRSSEELATLKEVHVVEKRERRDLEVKLAVGGTVNLLYPPLSVQQAFQYGWRERVCETTVSAWRRQSSSSSG